MPGMIFFARRFLAFSALSVAVAINQDIEVVHVINSCHLDLGFAGSSTEIVNLYEPLPSG